MVRRITVLVALVAVLGGCGRKSEPLPPIIEVPETTTDLAIRQEVDEAVLTWSYPKLTRAGTELVDLERIEVWRLEVPPGQEQVDNVDLKRQLMLGRGTIIARLEGESLAAATRGGSLVYRDPLPAFAAGSTPPTLWYAVRSRRRDGTVSALSNIAGGQPQPIPPAVEGLEATPEEAGIALSWQSEEGLTFQVERLDAPVAGWRPLNQEPLTSASFRDETATQGRTWSYRVRVTAGPIWGPPTPPLEVPYPDVYPPPPAASLVCLPEPGRVVLRWERSPEGAVRYTVRRRPAGGEEWTILAEVLAARELADEEPPDVPLEYEVRAVDTAGNESEPLRCTARPAA